MTIKGLTEINAPAALLIVNVTYCSVDFFSHPVRNFLFVALVFRCDIDSSLTGILCIIIIIIIKRLTLL